jgi:hypothetical protein
VRDPFRDNRKPVSCSIRLNSAVKFLIREYSTMNVMQELETDYERGICLQNILIARATGEEPSAGDYQVLRQTLMTKTVIKQLMPTFVRTNRDLGQFWQFIKYKFNSYQERRDFIYKEFQPLLDALEGKNQAPADTSISKALKSFDEAGVHAVWEKALDRRSEDPDGAITAARTLLETVCKHILDLQKVTYNPKKIEIHELYKLVAKELNLSPDQHNEAVFKQILGGCSSIVSGLGTLRNRLGDAHGQGMVSAKPSPRHAELAVNLAGSMAIFLVSTWQSGQQINLNE